MNSVSRKRIIHTFEYDRVVDLLYILLEPFRGWSFYQSVTNDPGVMRRYSADDERLVGFMVENVKDRLSSEQTDDEALRSLASHIVDQYA